jgi:hypothetical protein
MMFAREPKELLDVGRVVLDRARGHPEPGYGIKNIVRLRARRILQLEVDARTRDADARTRDVDARA